MLAELWETANVENVGAESATLLGHIDGNPTRMLVELNRVRTDGRGLGWAFKPN